MLKSGDNLQQGRYEIKGTLGQGGFGTVYQAHHTKLQRNVAIKETFIQSADAQKQFEREAMVLSRMDHPSLPDVIDYFEENGKLYLVMQFIPGEDLNKCLERQPNRYLHQNEALDYIAPVLDALEYLHNQNIIHRDIKPGNIRITPDNRVYLVDFGFAKKYDPSGLNPSSFTPATTGFSSYEQHHGEATPRSDLYALGATLYAMLSGKPPPDARQRHDKHVRLDSLINHNNSVSPKVDKAIQKLLNMKPEMRYASVASLRQDLQPESTETPPWWKWWIAGLAPLEAIGIIIGIVLAIVAFVTGCGDIICIMGSTATSDGMSGQTVSLVVVVALVGYMAYKAYRAKAQSAGTKAQFVGTPRPHQSSSRTPNPQPSQATPASGVAPVRSRINPLFPVTVAEWRDDMAQRNEQFGNPSGYWCYVRPGNYAIGGWKPNDAVETIALRGFWIAKYPITVQQYRQFMHAGGYTNKRLWTPNGWLWRTGYDKGKGRKQPWEWDNATYNSNDQPVIGVTWYEAAAFAAWLNTELAGSLPSGHRIRLPTEAEWEAAAAYDANSKRRTYPWGEQKPSSALVDNKNLGGIEAAAPVGGRPAGVAACGAHDMVGTVWEWSASTWDAYPTGSSMVGEDYKASVSVSLRGASWWNETNVLLCAARYWLGPLNVLNGEGFRLALSP